MITKKIVLAMEMGDDVCRVNAIAEIFVLAGETLYVEQM